MKIILITSIYLPHIGGIELYVKNLASCLISKGHDVSVFVGDRFIKKTSDSVEYGIRTVRVPVFYFKGMSYLKNKTGTKILKQELASTNIVHLNDVKFLYKFLAKSKTTYGYKLFFSSHGFIFHTKSFLFLKNLYMSKMQKYSRWYDINYCVSQNDLNIARKFNFKNLKMLVPGTDIHKFESVAFSKFEKGVFVCWGRIAPNKGILRLVEIFHHLKHNFSLKIIGGCDDNAYLSKIKSVSKDDSRIEFLGYKTDNEIRNYVQRAEFLVFPSLHEGFGMSLVEGLSSGKRIIANTIDTFEQILTECDESKFLFDFTKSSEELSEKISEIRYTTIKKKNLKRYSVEYMTDIIEKDYKG